MRRNSSVLVTVRGNWRKWTFTVSLALPGSRRDPSIHHQDFSLVCDGGTSRPVGVGLGGLGWGWGCLLHSVLRPLRSWSVRGEEDWPVRGADGPRCWSQQAEGRTLQEVVVMGVRVGGWARRTQSQLIGGSRRRHGRSYGQRIRQKSGRKGFGKFLEVRMSRVRLSKAAGFTSAGSLR